MLEPFLLVRCLIVFNDHIFQYYPHCANVHCAPFYFNSLTYNCLFSLLLHKQHHFFHFIFAAHHWFPIPLSYPPYFCFVLFLYLFLLFSSFTPVLFFINGFPACSIHCCFSKVQSWCLLWEFGWGGRPKMSCTREFNHRTRRCWDPHLWDFAPWACSQCIRHSAAQHAHPTARLWRRSWHYCNL